MSDSVVESDGQEIDDKTGYPVDPSCFLCVGLDPQPPEPNPMGVDTKEFHYCHGFADGVSTCLRGEGHSMCERHKTMIRAALLQRGVNWGPPERQRGIG